MRDRTTCSGGWAFVIMRGLPYVVAWAVVGVAVWFAPLPVPACLTLPGSRIPADRWGTLLGLYCFAVAGSALLINPSLMGIRILFDLASAEDVKPVHLWPPLLVGSCEAVLYPTAVLLGKAEFISVWLALKVAGQWSFWTGDYKGRNRFNMFLIGNALSIAAALVFARIIQAVVMTP